ELADWDSLNAEVRVFTEHIADPDELVRRLAGFDVVVAMRERTPFPESVLSRLPDLRLLVTTGQRNASIDVEAARRHGILVCGTGYLPHPTVELTWALILAACRNLPTEFQAMRDGGWQTTIGTGLRGKTLGVLGLGRLGVGGCGPAGGRRAAPPRAPPAGPVPAGGRARGPPLAARTRPPPPGPPAAHGRREVPGGRAPRRCRGRSRGGERPGGRHSVE